MVNSARTKNVIEATNIPHLFEKLDNLQKRFLFISSDWYLVSGLLFTK